MIGGSYCGYPTVAARVEAETDSEFDPQLWIDDPDMDLIARDWRDIELTLDWFGCIDAPL